MRLGFMRLMLMNSLLTDPPGGGGGGAPAPAPTPTPAPGGAPAPTPVPPPPAPTPTPAPIKIEIPKNWKEALPEDLRNDPNMGPILDLESLTKSFIHSQKMIGRDKIPVPDKFA